MTFKSIALATTALVLPMAAAAQTIDGSGNAVYLTQDGNRNDALITQFGALNSAGSDDTGLNGSDLDMDQTGTRNVLIVDQMGTFNEVGTDTSLLGISQQSDRNRIKLTQLGDSNSVGQVFQFNWTDFATRPNSARVEQTGSLNFVNSIVQAFESTGEESGVSNTVVIFQNSTFEESFIDRLSRSALGIGNAVGDDESLTAGILGNTPGVVQYGNANDTRIVQNGLGNSVGRVEQDGNDHSVDVRQIGDDNYIWRIQQTNTDAGGNFQNASAGNSATILQRGVGNGAQEVLEESTFTRGGSFYPTIIGAELGEFTLPDFGAAWGLELAVNEFLLDDVPVAVTQGLVYQEGTDNTVDYSAVGDFNLMGFVQDGTFHNALVSVNGSYNQTAVQQGGGDGNSAAIDIFDGWDNDIAMLQGGSSNEATVTLAEDGIADDNVIGILQIGDFNSADVAIVQGDFNVLGVAQVGDDNSVSVDIDGFGNGGGELSGSAAALTDLIDVPFVPAGLIIQGGFDNSASVDVAGDGNLFSMAQLGQSNDFDASVDGNDNEMAIVQVGFDNFAAVTQIGNGNNAGVYQMNAF